MHSRLLTLALAPLLLVGFAHDKSTPSSDTASAPATQRQTNRCAPNGTAVTTGGVGVVQIGAHMYDVALGGRA